MLMHLFPPARRPQYAAALASNRLLLTLLGALLLTPSAGVFSQTAQVWVQTADPAVSAGNPEVRAMQSARADWEEHARRPFSPQHDRRKAAGTTRGAVQGVGRPMPSAAGRPSPIKQIRYDSAPEPLPADPGYEASLEPGAVAMPYDGMAPGYEGEPLVEDAPWQSGRGAVGGRGMYAPGMACDGCCPPEGMCFGECAGRACGRCWRPFHNRLWLREEYILWWGKGDFLPSLATSSPADTAEDVAGVLGQPDTFTLFGGTGVNNLGRSGIRDTIGYWLDEGHCWGLEGAYFVQGSVSASFQGPNPGTQIVARPFFDVLLGAESALLVNYPDVRTGSLSIRETSDVEGAEFLLRRNVFRDCARRADLLIGYRYARLGDSLRIRESTTAEADDLILGDVAGTTRDISEVFDTTNEFNGAELGALAQWQGCRWSLELLMKVALGNTSSRARIDGRTLLTGNQADVLGGILAQQSNIGRYQRNEFSMIPELGIRLSRDLGCRLRATVGYTLIYWSKVMRPGELVDLNLNITQVPPGELIGAPEPRFSFATNDFWLHGLNLGIEYRF